MSFETVRKITVVMHVGKAKDLPREELAMEFVIGDSCQRGPVVQMTKKGSFNHTFTGDMEAGQELQMRVIRMKDESVHSTLTLPYSVLVASTGARAFEFTNAAAPSGKKPSVDMDVTVMAMMHAGVLDKSIDFFASPLPWFLKAEDIYGLAKRGLTVAHELPYADAVVGSLESLTEALLQKTALIHPEEGSTCLASLDELVTTTLATADNRVDERRMRIVDSIRGLVDAMERHVTEQREKVQEIASELQAKVKSRVSTTVTMAKERLLTTLALYEERYPTLATKGKEYITRIHDLAITAHNMVTDYYETTRDNIEHMYATTHDTARDYYVATVGAAYTKVTETVVKVPDYACQTLDQSTEYVKAVPLVGPYAAPYITSASDVIRVIASEWLPTEFSSAA